MYNIQYIGSRTATGAVAVLDGLYADQNISLGKIDVCVEVCVASMYNLIRSRVFESYHRMKIILALRSHNGN